MLFSQRMGYKPVREAIQFESVDTALRNGLWNALHYNWWYKTDKSEWGIDEDVESILTHIWVDYFKKAIDEKPVDMLKSLKHYFLTCKWFEVYDLIEFIANMEPAGKDFADRCNYALEREASAYRLVDNRFVPNTTNEELTEIEEAIDHTHDKKAVELHLRRALELLSDRAQPDYRNSIKESISAVESLTKLISGDQKATLGTALRLIEKDGSVQIHKALSNAYSALYGYTSDSAGIRHALTEGEEPLHFEDAKYMLVSCSAFINYLLAKADKAGKTLSL